jgi:hypothetical protein
MINARHGRLVVVVATPYGLAMGTYPLEKGLEQYPKKCSPCFHVFKYAPYPDRPQDASRLDRT